MTVSELIKDSVEYYKDMPRGIKLNSDGTNAGCEYRTDAGYMCAVGRCFNGVGLDYLGEHSGDIEDVLSDISDENEDNTTEYPYLEFDSYLKEEYHNIDGHAWSMLQLLHDGDDNWTKYKARKGYYLSDTGKKFIKTILTSCGEDG